MKIDSARTLFLHELADIYDAERQIADMLPKQAKEVEHGPLQDAFSRHQSDTEQQIRNLERCFEIMGEQPEGVICHVVRGLAHEHELVANQEPASQLLALYDMGAGLKTEHYEIASYEGLVATARSLDEPEVADLLQENLRQEKEMEKKIQQLRKDYEKEVQGPMS
jgi:ferritin-like metal-binding protein YciE